MVSFRPIRWSVLKISFIVYYVILHTVLCILYIHIYITTYNIINATCRSIMKLFKKCFFEITFSFCCCSFLSFSLLCVCVCVCVCVCLYSPYGLWKFPCQGSNSGHSSDLKCCSDNIRSLIHCATKELKNS